MGNGTAISFSFGFDLSGLQSGAARAQAMTLRAMGRIQQGSAAAFGAVAGASMAAFNKIVAVAEDVASKVNGVFQKGEELTALSKRTGIAAGRLYQMQGALRSVKVDADALGPAVAKMQQSIVAGSPKAQAAFDELGLTLASLKGMSPDQQFQAIGKAIGGLSDPAARTADSMAIFGKAGAQLLPLFTSAGAMNSMGGALSAKAQEFQRSSADFAAAAQNIRRVQSAFSGFFIGLAGGLATNLNALFGSAKIQDFTAAGRMFGEYIGKGITFVMDAIPFIQAGFVAAQAVFAEIGAMVADIVNETWNGFQIAGDLFAAAFHTATQLALELSANMLEMPVELGIKLQSALQYAFSTVITFFANGFWDVIASLSAGLQFALQEAFRKVIDLLPARLRSILGIEQIQGKTLAQFRSDADTNLGGHKTTAPSYGNIESQVGDQWHGALFGVMAAANLLHAGAADSSRKANAAMERAGSRQTQDVAGAADWHAAAAEFGKKASEAFTAAQSAGMRRAVASAASSASNGVSSLVNPASLIAGPASGFTLHTLDGPKGFDLQTGQMRSMQGLREVITAGGIIRKQQEGLGGGAYGYSRMSGQVTRDKAEIEAKKRSDEVKQQLENISTHLENLNTSNDELVDGLT